MDELQALIEQEKAIIKQEEQQITRCRKRYRTY